MTRLLVRTSSLRWIAVWRMACTMLWPTASPAAGRWVRSSLAPAMRPTPLMSAPMELSQSTEAAEFLASTSTRAGSLMFLPPFIVSSYIVRHESAILRCA